MKALTTVAAPCAKCPFRKDVPIYLRADRRREIAEALILRDETFHCHETVDYRDDDDGETYGDTTNARPCAGAAKAVMAAGGMGQMLRIEERLGLVDPQKIAERGAPVWTLAEWPRLAEGSTGDDPRFEDDDEESGACGVVNGSCLAPAGYLGASGGVIEGTETVDTVCPVCGEFVCEECSDDEGRCLNGMCSDDEEDDRW